MHGQDFSVKEIDGLKMVRKLAKDLANMLNKRRQAVEVRIDLKTSMDLFRYPNVYKIILLKIIT